MKNVNNNIAYILQLDGTVAITRMTQIESDPILKQFLDLLTQDIENNPQRLQSISSDSIDHLRSLVSDVDFELDQSIDNSELGQN